MPILRAVPLIISAAFSTVWAFKSGIFILAISMTWSIVTDPILLLLGSPEPFSTLAAFNSKTDAGGVLVIKVNERSE